MNDDWKGEHLIRAPRKQEAVSVTIKPTQGEKAIKSKARNVESLRKAYADGLNLTQAAKQAGISLTYAWVLNRELDIGFKSKSWASRRQGLIA